MSFSSVGVCLLVFSLIQVRHFTLAAVCEVPYDSSAACDDNSCFVLDEDKAIKVYMNADGSYQMQFLTMFDYLRIDGSDVFGYTKYADKFICSIDDVHPNGIWTRRNLMENITFTTIAVMRQAEVAECSADGNYDITLCDSNNYVCDPIPASQAFVIIPKNESTNQQQMLVLRPPNELWYQIIVDDSGFTFDVVKDANNSIFCVNGYWYYFSSPDTLDLQSIQQLLFSRMKPTPPQPSNACSPNLNYDSTLCDRVKSSDQTVTYCAPVTDTSQLFTIKDNGLNEQTVTFLTKTLKAAVFLPNGTMYRTAFASDALKTKVSCSRTQWVLYDSPTKQSLPIDKLIIFKDVCDKPCSSDLNYDSTLCPLVMQKATNPTVTTCNPVLNTAQLFTIQDNGGCSQTATFLTKTLKTAIFLPNGELYKSVFASESLKDRVSCSNGTWIFYEKTTKTTYEIGKLILFT